MDELAQRFAALTDKYGPHVVESGLHRRSHQRFNQRGYRYYVAAFVCCCMRMRLVRT